MAQMKNVKNEESEKRGVFPAFSEYYSSCIQDKDSFVNLQCQKSLLFKQNSGEDLAESQDEFLYIQD